MKQERDNTIRPSQTAHGRSGISRLAHGRRAEVVDNGHAVRRQNAIRMFFREEVNLLSSAGDDYVATRRDGGLVLH